MNAQKACEKNVNPTPTPTGVNCVDSANKDKDTCEATANNGACAFIDSKCVCAAGYGSSKADGSDCAPCKGSEYKAAASVAKCDTCAEGSYTAPANGSDSKITNTTGPNTQCIAAGSSSASPLAILIICSLIISIIASIATAAVMIRRKANNARAAEAIVSDAL